VVVIDPGHQGGNGPGGVEPLGPGSSTMKDKYAYGTSGVVTGTPESELVLAVSLKLRDALQARGITAIIERTSQSQALSNVERAQIANENHADLFIRVHADGIDNQSVHGISVLTPASINGWTDTIAGPSKQAAQLALNALVAATGASNRGLSVRSDMTGFNWSKVPVILPEIGFMTNPDEDRRLATAAYQQKIANALADAAVQFIQGR
jgi:N-acetylmuramoyl-L-alanine amidase